MKKVILGIVLSVLLSASASYAKNVQDSKFQLSFGGFSFVKKNENNEIIGYRGINTAIGYTSISYLSPLVVNEFNPFWSWGTGLLVLPYIGAGVDYVLDNGVFVRGGIIYLSPYASVGFTF
ncbi:MAG: hypothetical protein CL521_00005 [Actinobacteria bacterium]|nr:hypothetical protein [Actinomycetota bacterium]